MAEIPGVDPQLKSELVIIGGHLDSWHSGTGATDNGAGCIVMMEVMRILRSLGVEPKRTIRITLWDGEEQGLYGSYNYVRNHFADVNTMQLKPDYNKVSAYYNLDNGSGKIQGHIHPKQPGSGPNIQELAGTICRPGCVHSHNEEYRVNGSPGI